MTPAQDALLSDMKDAARALATRLGEAIDGGVPPAVLLPELLGVLKESGISVPGMPRL